MIQGRLFPQELSLGIETAADTLSRMRDRSPSVRRLVGLAERVASTDDPVVRARLASQLRDLAEEVNAASIRRASRDGVTWRQLGTALGVPFQSLYRRYGST